MKTLSSKRRPTSWRPHCEFLEFRTLLSTTPDGTIAVQLASPADATALNQLATSDGATSQATSVPGLVMVQGTSGDLAEVLAAASGDPSVQYVEPVRTVQAAVVPNDPEFTNGDLWGLNGTYGINAPAAWNVTTGSPATVTVADIDTGIDYDHPDLYQNIWINQPEIPTSRMKNLVDVYHDGYISWRDLNNPVNIGPGKITDVNGDGVIDAADILAPMVLNAQGQDTGTGGWANPNNTQDGDTAHPDDLIGWNFVNNTNNPFDDNGHGTHTAGTIGAMGNDGIGVVGVNWNTQIMALKFLDNTGNGTDVAGAEAIDYAAMHGAKVINASWGSTDVSSTLENAITLANSDGVVFVAAAGNSSLSTDGSPFYPADYNIPNVISVGALASDGTRAGFSNFGSKSVDLFAPGQNIESTYPNDQYIYDSGTSMAAPHVTGTVALVEGLHPTWTVSQIVNQILSTVTPDPSLQNLAVTGGILNAGAAVAIPTSASASFVGTDATTQGHWRTAYGGDGYDIEGDSSATNPNLPSYASVSVTGNYTYTWGTNTGSPYALQNAAANGDIAATWFSPSSFNINVGISDGKAHLVTLYALDWDQLQGWNVPRSERIDILNALTGQVLDTRTLSSFQGEDISWNISGNVTIRVTNLVAGNNAVISGIFFGSATG